MGQWGIEKTFFGVKVQAHINTKTFDLISYSDKIDCVILMAGPDKKISYAILEKVKKRFLGQIYSKWCNWELWDKEEPAPTLSCEFPELKPEDVAGFHGRDYPSGDFKTFKPHEKFKTGGFVPKKSNSILTFKCAKCSNIYRCAGNLKTPSAQKTCPECGGSMWLKGEPGTTIDFPEVELEYQDVTAENIAKAHGISFGTKPDKYYVGIFNTITGEYKPFPKGKPGKTVFLKNGEQLVDKAPMMKRPPHGLISKRLHREKLVDREPFNMTTQHVRDVRNDLLKKPPIGLMPRKLHREERFSAVERAISNYFFEGKDVPAEWINKFNDLLAEAGHAE